MSLEKEDELFKEYQQDPRIPCQYGAKCYQKNPVHHQKYKHPPGKVAKNKKIVKNATGKKRKFDIAKGKKGNDEPRISPERKQPKLEPDPADRSSSSPSRVQIEEDPKTPEESTAQTLENIGVVEDPSEQCTIASLIEDLNLNSKEVLSIDDARKVIPALFLTEIPEDFYKFYELCQNISKNEPLSAFRAVGLILVGPFDVFRQNFLQSKISDKSKLPLHWRYFYDPPEFQTLLKSEDKDGHHYGYWRDAPSEKPVFVASNKSNVDCKFVPVAANIFGAVDEYITGKIKTMDPFKQASVTRLHQKLKKYAKDSEITLDRMTSEMQSRQRNTVAKTFHRAGIVVPYDKKTQLGYRQLAVTEKELEKVLRSIETAETAEKRKAAMKGLEEVIRWATIAADECDFGTCLELGHDLFSSGIEAVHSKALHMLSIAYTHLQRPEFLKIAQAHLKDRRKSQDLAVL